MRSNILSVLSTALLAGSLAAQTYNYSPAGSATLEGSSNNTIPFWAGSATYQQVHDATDLTNTFNGAAALINSIHLRKDGFFPTNTVIGRSFDLQITVGHTTVTAATITNTFATNLGGAPATVLPYTNVSVPNLTHSAIPNPVGWSFPFNTPFPWVAASGNLCWEFRLRNNTVTTTAILDASAATSSIVMPNLGAGCIATGQTSPAAITTRSLSMTTGAYRNVLSRGAANAPAAFFIGLAQQTITLPGLCSSLETFPVVDVPGATSATGSWDLSIVFGPLVGGPHAQLFGQFVFLDAGLPLSIGLSDASWMATPPRGASEISRAWFGGSGSGQGNETATTGSFGTRYGLLTIFGT